MSGGPLDPEEGVTIGKVLKPRGIQGEAFLLPLTDFPERFQDLDAVWIDLSDGARTDLQVEAVRVYGRRLGIKFRGVETPESVARFSGCYLLVPRDAIHPLPEDTFYIFEVVGLRVETGAGEEVGRVVDVLSFPGNDVYVVDRGGEEVLLPAVRELMEIDRDGSRIVVRDMEGLL